MAHISTVSSFILCRTGAKIQTRSEETGIVQHDSLEEALIAVRGDPTIWKISYETATGFRARYVRRKDYSTYFDFILMGD